MTLCCQVDRSFFRASSLLKMLLVVKHQVVSKGKAGTAASPDSVFFAKLLPPRACAPTRLMLQHVPF